MEKQYILPAGLRDSLINFLRTMPMEAVEQPVVMLRSLQTVEDALQPTTEGEPDKKPTKS